MLARYIRIMLLLELVAYAAIAEWLHFLFGWDYAPLALGAIAAGLTFLGDRLGIDLYLVALFAFGWRIFQNVAVIRRHFL